MRVGGALLIFQAIVLTTCMDHQIDGWREGSSNSLYLLSDGLQKQHSSIMKFFSVVSSKSTCLSLSLTDHTVSHILYMGAIFLLRSGFNKTS